MLSWTKFLNGEHQCCLRQWHATLAAVDGAYLSMQVASANVRIILLKGQPAA